MSLIHHKRVKVDDEPVPLCGNTQWISLLGGMDDRVNCEACKKLMKKLEASAPYTVEPEGAK